MTSTALQAQMAQHPALAASVGAIRAKLDLKYTEQLYAKTLTELEGSYFEPLAGIRVTFLPIIEGHVTQPEGSSNLIMMAQYVEYLTGRRRTLAAVVDLVDGYVPIGVELRAFEDALRHAVEALLNECGYTLEKEAPDGLRKMEKIALGHGMLKYLFRPLVALDRLGGIVEDNVEVVVEDDAVVLRVAMSALFESEGDHLKRISTLASFPYQDYEDVFVGGFNRIHRSQLGPLECLYGEHNLWIEMENRAKKTIEHTYLTKETVLVNPHGKVTNPDRTETLQLYPNYDMVWSLNETPSDTLSCLPKCASGVVRDQVLTVRIPLDLSSSFDKGTVVVEDIKDWVSLYVHGIKVDTELVENAKMQSVCVIDRRVVSMARKQARPGVVSMLEVLKNVAGPAAERAAEREEQARRDAIAKTVNTPSKYKDVIDVPPAEPVHYGLLTRLSVAFKAFTNPGIWKKD